jgi:flagellar P-ring protein precursor FlgI
MKTMTQSVHRTGKLLIALLMLGVSFATAAAAEADGRVLVRDIATIAGVRENPLVGYGIVVGLNGTGDRQQTVFTIQMLSNAMQRMGVQFPSGSVRVNNVAAVFVTASLPAFARPGMTLDVTVSSIGDAKSLEGGVLLMTSLHGVDGQVYADAQGPLTIGGYSVSSGSNTKQVNHSTVGRIASGAIVERDTAVDLSRMKTVSLMLREPDFSAARDLAAAVNKSFGKEIASALDNRRIDVDVPASGISSVPTLIAKVQEIPITVHPLAKVVINERTGTIVMGGDVRLSPVSVLHGNLSIEVNTVFTVSQPNPLSRNGETVVVPQTTIQANAAPARSIKLADGASVDQLIGGLQAIGATARDIVAILQAIKAAGGLQAELEVL